MVKRYQVWRACLAALVIALCSTPAFAAGTVTQTISQIRGFGFVLTFSWTADVSDGSVPNTVTSTDGTAAITGLYLTMVETNPGGVAPTDNYDLQIQSAAGADLMGGALANRDATATEISFPSKGTPPIDGALTLTLSGNAVNSATGTVKLYITHVPQGGGIFTPVTITDTLTADEDRVIIALDGRAGVSATITGTHSMTMIAELSGDGGITWDQTDMFTRSVGTVQFAVAANGLYTLPWTGGGITHASIRADTYASGTATVTMTATFFPMEMSDKFTQGEGGPAPANSVQIGIQGPSGETRYIRGDAAGVVSINQAASTIGGASTFYRIALGTIEDEHEVKATPGKLYSVTVTNTNAATRVWRCYNLTAANTTPGTSSVFISAAVGPSVAAGPLHLVWPAGLDFSVALTCTFTTGIADTDVAEVAANEVRAVYTFK